MVEKKYLLITSLILTVAVFLGGISLGWTLDHYKANELLENIKASELTTDSFIVEESFIEHYGGNRCELLNTRVYDMQHLIHTTGQQLSKWGEGDSFQKNDFDYLKRKYVILEIRFYMMITDLKKECGEDYDTILFFYSKDQDVSSRQGEILNKLTDNYDNLIVLSIDKDYHDEPLVDLLALKYNVTTAPTMIVNSKMKFEGLTSQVQIENAVK